MADIWCLKIYWLINFSGSYDLKSFALRLMPASFSNQGAGRAPWLQVYNAGERLCNAHECRGATV